MSMLAISVETLLQRIGFIQRGQTTSRRSGTKIGALVGKQVIGVVHGRGM